MAKVSETATAEVAQASEPAEDDEPFEIRDYSVASPWEELISKVEEAIRGWTRRGDDATAGPPTQHRLQYGGRELLLSCHGEPSDHQRPPEGALPRFMREMLEPSADFAAGEAFAKDPYERLRRWFGIQTFVLLQPAAAESLDASEMALLQGTLNVALLNSNPNTKPKPKPKPNPNPNPKPNQVALLNCGCAMPGFVSHEPARGGFCGRTPPGARTPD